MPKQGPSRSDWLTRLRQYNQLDDIDKGPLIFQPIRMKPLTGRFARRKSGHVGIVAMRRCFTTGGSPALPPNRSRLVEAICIYLSNRHLSNTTITSPGKRKQFQSRWKSILADYTNIRARLFNSHHLLAKTNIALYTINETTLMHWHKHFAKKHRLYKAPAMIYPEPEDRTGLVKQRKSSSHSHPIIPYPQPIIPYSHPIISYPQPPIIPYPQPIISYPQPQVLPPTQILQRPMYNVAILPSTAHSIPLTLSRVELPKTTYYRHLKSVCLNPPMTATAKKRKVYSCRKCGQRMVAPHSQFLDSDTVQMN